MKAQLERFLGSSGFARLRRLARGDDGQDLIEYALLASLLSIVAVIGVTALGQKVHSLLLMLHLQIRS
jgi:Flp pilus assembly pilin Flp